MTAIIPTRPASVASARRSASDWCALMRAYLRSGETRKQFCARRGLALSTFDWWRRRLREDLPVRVASRSSSPAQPSALFVELAQEEKPVTVVMPRWEVELELGRSVVLRLRRTAC